MVQNRIDMEEWRDIKDYEQLYQISSMGRVKSLNYNHTGKERIMKGCNNGNGYLYVGLCKEGKRKNYLVHRLVAQAFLDNPNNLPQINHKDEDKTNNRVENIEYCDRSYNLNYGTHNERVAKALSIPILQFSKTGEFIRKWESAKEVERELGLNQGNISKCCQGKLKSAGGYVWGYEKDYERIPFKVFDLEIYEKKKVA